MGWNDFIPAIPGVGDLIKKGTDIVSDGVAGGFNAAASATVSKLSFDKIESILKNDVAPDNVNIKSNVKSELGEFLQKSMDAIAGRPIAGNYDGKAGGNTVGNLNGFFAAKKLSAEDGLNPLRDKFEDLNDIKNISELSGRHIQAVIDELRDLDIIPENAELTKDLGEALRDVENPDLQQKADELAPASGRTSSVDNESLGVVADTGVAAVAFQPT